MSYDKGSSTTSNTHSGYERTNPVNPQYGRDTLGDTDNRSGPSNVSSSEMRNKSDMNTSQTYGGIGSGATGASTATSIPESSTTTGRATTAGTYDLSSSGTGANTAAIDPSTTAHPQSISGAGIHAQQYRGREGEYGVGTTTTISSGVTPGIGHHVSHHHHHGHGHGTGDTSTGQTLFEKEKVHHAPGTTGAGVGMGATHATTGMAGAQAHTGMGVGTGASTGVAGAQAPTGAGVGMGAAHPTTGMAGAHAQGPTGATTDRERAVGQQEQPTEHGATHHGKPTMLDKIIGGTEKGIGKITSNTTMVQEGTERAAGEFEHPSKN